MAAKERLLTSYDLVPYPKMAFSQTHPDRLATIGTLFGLSPTPVTRARVLELGCASGTNLLPMADQYPESEFVGVDMSGKQISEANTVANRVGLKNARFVQQDIANIGDEYGRFDYVICHGVFSWVPRHVQDRILGVCNDLLTPQGVAYISYNTNPGWRMRSILRDMMLYSANQFADPKQQMAQSLELLKFVAANASDKDPFGAFLKCESQAMTRHNPSYVFHEYLEKTNTPSYFHEFMEHASRHRLQYLGEAEIAAMWPGRMPKKVVKTLEKVAKNLIQKEQIADFVRNRMFRQTLLCRAEAKLRRDLGADALQNLYIASPIAEVGNASVPGIEFRHRSGKQALTTVDREVITALRMLQNAWPNAVQFRKVVEKSIAESHDRVVNRGEATDIQETIGKVLLDGIYKGVVELHSVPSNIATQCGEYPMVAKLTRLQGEHGNEVINLRHRSVRLNDISRRVLTLLDGNNHRDRLAEQLESAFPAEFAAGRRPNKEAGGTVVATDLAASVSAALDSLVKNCFLLA